MDKVACTGEAPRFHRDRRNPCNRQQHGSGRGRWAPPRRPLICCLLFLVTTLPFSLFLAHGKTPSLVAKRTIKAGSASNLVTSNLEETTSKNATLSTSGTTSSLVLQIVETEVYDGRIWKAPGGSSRSQSFRWTDTDGEIAPSPDQWKGYDWTSDWKIVTSPQRDEFGWEYEFQSRMPIRRRVWLRTYNAGTAIRRKKKGKRSNVSKVVQLVMDDFNFKGFGFTFYKSLVFLKSFGVAFRIPGVTNFNTWESHPSMPNFATSIAYYTPGTFVLFLNASVRYEWLQWVLTNTVSTIVYAAAWLVWTLLIRGLITAGSALLFPITRQLWLNPQLPLSSPDWRIPPAFSRAVEERLGCSWSWRVSLERGYEYRVSYWHYFAPTLVGLLRGWKGVPAFLVRHAAAVGLSTSGPIPDEPYITSAALFALSGFYFSSRKSPTSTLASPVTISTLDNLDDASAESDEATSALANNTHVIDATDLLRL